MKTPKKNNHPNLEKTFTEKQIVEAINSFKNIRDWKAGDALYELKKKLGIMS